MMKPSIKYLIVLFGALLVFMPGRVLAVVPPMLDIDPKVKLYPGLQKPKVKNLEAFCNSFATAADKIASTLSEKSDAVSEAITESKNNYEEKRNARDAKLEEARSKADARRSEWYARLEAKAKSDDEKDAVVKFKQAMEKAVEKRRDAVDAAIEEFRKGVDAAITGRKTSMKESRDAFSSAVLAASAQVKADCENGGTTQDIKKKFKDSLKAARETLKSDKKDMDKVGEQVKALAATRQVALKKALSDFTAAVEIAKTELKQVFNL